MFDKTITTKETGDTSLKELYEHRGYLLQKKIDNLDKEWAYVNERLDKEIDILLKKTEELIEKHLQTQKL